MQLGSYFDILRREENMRGIWDKYPAVGTTSLFPYLVWCETGDVDWSSSFVGFMSCMREQVEVQPLLRTDQSPPWESLCREGRTVWRQEIQLSLRTACVTGTSHERNQNWCLNWELVSEFSPDWNMNKSSTECKIFTVLRKRDQFKYV